MNTNNALIQLLIISDQSAQTNQLVSRLRTKNIRLKAERIECKTEFQKQLSSQQWDLVICFENASVAVEDALHLLKELDLTIPLLFISAENSKKDSEQLLKLGVRDVIPESEEGRLFFGIKHEANNHQLRRQNIELGLALKELESRHQLLLNSACNAFSYIRNGMHLYCNPSYAQLFSHDDADSIAATLLIDLIATDDRVRFNKFLSQKISIEEKIVIQAQPSTGTAFDVEMIFTPAEFEGEDCLQLSIKAPNGNIEYAREIESLRSQDLLTNLDNANLFSRKTEAAIREALKLNTFSSMLIIQLDEFVDITSTIGKPNANIVIRDISQFLQNAIKKPFSAARLSNHEFGLILYDGNPKEALELASFIKSRINNHITATALPSLELSCSIGIAVINGKALDAEDIISKARGNLNNQLPYAQSYKLGTANADAMLNYLREALTENKFTLRFQAIVDIKGSGFACYEVLTRILNDNNSEILPASFIPLANLNGMGEDIDRMVIGLALDVLNKAVPPPPRLIINLTSNSLVSKTFLPWLSKALQGSGASPDSLLFQISEIDIYNNLDAALEFCKGLDELNLKKTICHFGCAVNPFEHLAELNPEHVKLDISIISDIFDGGTQIDSVRSLINKLHRHNFLVVAPQVEKIEVLPLLWEIGADYVQGYCLQKPSQEMNYEFNEEEEITLDAVQFHS